MWWPAGGAERRYAGVTHLDASRLDAELSRAETAPIDLNHLLEALADIYQTPAGGAARAQVMLAPMEKDLVIVGLGARLVQVLQNLIDNAISFSPPHGKISPLKRNDG